jgi:hypothetical protein
MWSVLSINIFFIGEDLPPQKKKVKNEVKFSRFFILSTWKKNKNHQIFIFVSKK